MTYYTPPHHHHHYHANMYTAPYGDHGDFYPHPPHPSQLYATAPAPPPMYYDHRNWYVMFTGTNLSDISNVKLLAK